MKSLIIPLLLVPTLSFGSTIYKCPKADGGVIYRSSPCPGGDTGITTEGHDKMTKEEAEELIRTESERKLGLAKEIEDSQRTEKRDKEIWSRADEIRLEELRDDLERARKSTIKRYRERRVEELTQRIRNLEQRKYSR